jgi:hypothetical protein
MYLTSYWDIEMRNRSVHFAGGTHVGLSLSVILGNGARAQKAVPYDSISVRIERSRRTTMLWVHRPLDLLSIARFIDKHQNIVIFWLNGLHSEENSA